MSAQAANAFEFEEHRDFRGDITTVVRRKPTVGAMVQQPVRRDSAQPQQPRPNGVRN